ncbi:MAG: hypothetical protein E4H01_04900, partial [Lysobacterales bacterium]
TISTRYAASFQFSQTLLSNIPPQDLRRRCAWIHPDQAKGRKAIAVPLSAAAILVLREQIGKHPVNVFSYRGYPIKQLNTKAWRKALERAGI